MTKSMRCHLCNSNQIQLFSERLRYESPRKVYRCDVCGLIFLYPQMSVDEERIFYEKEYGEIFSQEKGTTPAQLFESRLPDARLYYQWTRDFLKKTHACLELGCASGYFLATIKEHVKSVAGIETHTILKEYCRNIGIPIYDSLNDFPDEQFDRVFMFFLLEHVGNPINYLKTIKRIMKKDGKLFIVVPNVNDALLTLYDIPAFKSFYFTPAHQFYYSKETLSQIIAKAGMNDFTIYPKQRYDLSNHMHWMMFGKPGGTGRYNSVFSKNLLNEYARNLMDHFLCDTLFSVVTRADSEKEVDEKP